MNRKEWLEKFIELCDTGASTLDFRRYCRVKAQHLPRHTRRLEEFRAELALLQAKEDEASHSERIRKARLESLEKARLVRAEQADDRLAALRAAQEASDDEDEDTSGED